MPSILNTPESLLPRSDSKNPSTTCKGITSNGRPCRRSLAASSRSLPGRGVLAIAPDVGGNHEGAAAYFCWQHKDQAANLVVQQSNSHLLELKERNSIDTLVDRLGVLEVKDKPLKRREKRSSGGRNDTVRRDTLPQQWQGISSPLMAVPEESISASRPDKATQLPARPPQRQRRRGDIHMSFFCCMRRASSENLPAPRPRPHQKPEMVAGSHSTATRPSLAIQSHTQTNPSPTHSQTSKYLSYIPTNLTPATASILLTELAKPLTPSDHEPGYIYIFWLTPRTVPQPAANAASSLLAPPSRSERAGNARRTSDVLRDFAEVTSTSESNRAVSKDSGREHPPKRKTIMLKIGRASNVHRRMVQWTKQCGHNITLLRYYPHASHTSPSPSPSPPRSRRLSPSPSDNSIPPHSSASPSPPQKAPLIPRVERLIHLELQDKRVMRSCEGCSKEHREWFEVEASREGVRAVDECVRRWVRWALQEGAGEK